MQRENGGRGGGKEGRGEERLMEREKRRVEKTRFSLDVFLAPSGGEKYTAAQLVRVLKN